MGHRYMASSRHVRMLLYAHYRIAYLVKDDRNVDILGVFHGSLHITRYNSESHITTDWSGRGTAAAPSISKRS
jgi:hypothetical protein